MNRHFMTGRKFILFTLTLLLIFGIVIGCFFLFFSPKACRGDYKRFKSETYDSVMLSMFPTDHYEEESFTFWRGQNLIKANYNIPNFKTLKNYVTQIAKSGNSISCIYLGIRPDALSAQDVLSLIQQYPSTQFQIILPYPVLSYWQSLSDSEFAEEWDSYYAMADALLSEPNCNVYLFSRPWVICNPSNYTDTFTTNADTSLKLMLNCDEYHPYVLTAENMESTFGTITELLLQARIAPTSYPDLSGEKIVFFGDSVIGNYTDSASIPGVVAGLTGATVYNCGYGGNSATYIGEEITLPGITDAFIQKDLSPLPEDKQVYFGMSSYFEDAANTAPLCFVINYGLNDYFERQPIASDDPYDISTFAGALRTAIKNLRDNYPDSQIILMTPTYNQYIATPDDPAYDTEPFTDYVATVKEIGAAYGVTVLDNYADLGINYLNFQDYLADGVHPNETTRFLIAQRICNAIVK